MRERGGNVLEGLALSGSVAEVSGRAVAGGEADDGRGDALSVGVALGVAGAGAAASAAAVPAAGLALAGSQPDLAVAVVVREVEAGLAGARMDVFVDVVAVAGHEGGIRGGGSTEAGGFRPPELVLVRVDEQVFAPLGSGLVGLSVEVVVLAVALLGLGRNARVLLNVLFRQLPSDVDALSRVGRDRWNVGEIGGGGAICEPACVESHGLDDGLAARGGRDENAANARQSERHADSSPAGVRT
jgi:hypothetical protein